MTTTWSNSEMCHHALSSAVIATGPGIVCPSHWYTARFDQHQVEPVPARQVPARAHPRQRAGELGDLRGRLCHGFRVLRALFANPGQRGGPAVTEHTRAFEEVLDPANHRVRQAILHRHEVVGDLARQ